jgi:hypothetical protein
MIFKKNSIFYFIDINYMDSPISLKPIKLVLTEAIIVGLLLIGFVKLVKDYLLQYIPNLSGQKENIELFFVAGFLFHVVCEYTGINLWYSREYCKLL